MLTTCCWLEVGRWSGKKQLLGSVDSDCRWTWHSGNFTFRVREISPGEGIHVTMKDNAATLLAVETDRARKKYMAHHY